MNGLVLCLFSAESVDACRRRGSKDHPCCQLPPSPGVSRSSRWPVPPGRATTGSQRSGVGQPLGPRGRDCPREALMPRTSSSPQSSENRGTPSPLASRKFSKSWAVRYTTRTVTTRRARGAPGRKERLKEFRDSLAARPFPCLSMLG